MNMEERIKNIENELEIFLKKAEIWQQLFEEFPVAIAVFTSDMKFFLVNQAFTDLTDYSDGEISGQKISIVLPVELRRKHKRYEKDFSNNLEKKVSRHGLSPCILNRTRDKIDVRIDLSYLEYQGNVYYVSFISKIDNSSYG